MRRTRRSYTVATALLAGCLAGPLQAQVAAGDAGPLLVVLDAVTLAPVPGAVVHARGAGAFHADADGRVPLPPAPAGKLVLTVSSLGYVTQEVQSDPAAATLTVRLQPDPPVLEGLRAVVDRLEYRRARTFGPVRVMDERELAGRSPGGLAAHVRVMAGGIGPCMEVAGGCDGEPAVLLVDDWTFPFRLSELDDFEPATLYAVEVYPRESIVRVYTRDFMARAAANPRLVPLHRGLGSPVPVTGFLAPTFAGAFGAYVLAGTRALVAPARLRGSR